MLKKDNFFFCYSSKLSKYLEQKGISYIFIAREYKSGTPFSIYERSVNLNEALDEYKLNN